MPAPPEIGDCGGDIGVVEVFEKMESKHEPESDCHVGIAREVKIDLNCKRDNAKKCRRGADLGEMVRLKT